MLKSFTFGCGQGATKAMVRCIESGALHEEDCCVVNSTTKDIPSTYRNKAIVISDDPSAGCGKVRGAAKALMVKWLKENPNTINELIPEDTDYVNIIATTEGASGSGASVVLAKYIKSELDLPVILTIITGFESDIRGLSNTIEYFKDLNGGDYVINTISNKKVLANGNNTFNAEKEANDQIATYFRIINAEGIIDSEQNIDDTDRFKLITNPGMMFVTETNVDSRRIKNDEQFEKLITDAIDYTVSLDFKPSASKIGIFMNVSDDLLYKIDTSFTDIKKRLCSNDSTQELFIHSQYDANQPEFIRIIASGMDLPTDELVYLYKKYTDQNTVKQQSDFFNVLAEMDTSIDDTSMSKSSTSGFFDQFSDEPINSEDEAVIRRSSRKRRKATSSSIQQSTVSEEDTMISNTKAEEKRNIFSTNNKSRVSKEVVYSEDANPKKY